VDVINKTYLSHLYRNSNYHKYKTEQEEFSAKVINVESDGRLVLKTDDDKIKNFYFKEVEFVL
jgi:BirA family biotin operon repressor/biotin-[acetyl-CoA-carboxylase] ligase